MESLTGCFGNISPQCVFFIFLMVSLKKVILLILKEVQCINILLLLHNSGSQRFSPFILKTLGFQLFHLLRLLLFFWLHYEVKWISVLWPRIEPRPWQWKHQTLTIRQPGNLRYLFLYMVWDEEWGFLFFFFFEGVSGSFLKRLPFLWLKINWLYVGALFLGVFHWLCILNNSGTSSWLRW